MVEFLFKHKKKEREQYSLSPLKQRISEYINEMNAKFKNTSLKNEIQELQEQGLIDSFCFLLLIYFPVNDLEQEIQVEKIRTSPFEIPTFNTIQLEYNRKKAQNQLLDRELSRIEQAFKETEKTQAEEIEKWERRYDILLSQNQRIQSHILALENLQNWKNK